MGAIQSQKLINELQQQVMHERYAADVYYSLAAQLDDINLTGMSAWMMKASDEEREHAKKFSGYLADRFVRPVLTALPDPTKVNLPDDPFKAGKLAFETVQALEQFVTGRITMLYDLAYEENDPQTQQWLLWALEEQTGAEREIDTILTRFRLAEGNGAALLALDEALGG